MQDYQSRATMKTFFTRKFYLIAFDGKVFQTFKLVCFTTPEIQIYFY